MRIDFIINQAKCYYLAFVASHSCTFSSLFNLNKLSFRSYEAIGW